MKTSRILILAIIASFLTLSAFADSGKALSSSRKSPGKSLNQGRSPSKKQYTPPKVTKPSHSNHDNRGHERSHDRDRDRSYDPGHRDHGKSGNHGHHGHKDWKSYDKYWSNYHPSLRPGGCGYSSGYSVRIHTPPIYYGTHTYRHVCSCAYDHPSYCRCSDCGYYKTYKIYRGQKRVFSHYEKVFSHYEYVTTQKWIPETRVSTPVEIGEFTVNVSTVITPGHYEDVTTKVPHYKNVARYKYVSDYDYEKRWVSTKPSRCRCYYR